MLLDRTEFREIGATVLICVRTLTDYLSSFFNNPSSGTTNPIRSTLNKIFDKYREDPKNEPDEINIAGMGKLLAELQIELGDVGALIFSEIISSPSLGKITREGFVDGWAELTTDSLPKMRTLVLQRRSQLGTDKELFKSVYNHTFTLALQERAKTISLDEASGLWMLLFTAPGYEWKAASSPWLDWWIEFHEEKKTKAVNKDVWKQTFNFAEATMRDETLGFWSDESSWPSVIDEFVEWVKKEKRGGDAMEAE